MPSAPLAALAAQQNSHELHEIAMLYHDPMLSSTARMIAWHVPS